MRTKLAKALVVLTLVGAIGGHWTLFQSVAWVGMAVSYSQNATWKEALVKTFDGKHPCRMCKAVQEGKKSEKAQATLKVETKLDFYLARGAFLLYPPPLLSVVPGTPESVHPRCDPPPTPPPRAA